VAELGLPVSLAVLADALHLPDRSSAEYQAALRDWPNERQIWPHLRTRDARVEFIRSLLQTDLTNCRPYFAGTTRAAGQCAAFARNRETFVHLCMGFSTQLHIRLRDRPEAPAPDQIGRLRSEARIYYEEVDPKFRIPIYIAFSSTHAFNAILVEPDPSRIESYVFVEPQGDDLFSPASRRFRERDMYFGQGLLEIAEFEEIDRTGGIETGHRHGFIRDIFGGAASAGDLTDAQWRRVDEFRRTVFVFELPRSVYITRPQVLTDYPGYVRRMLARFPDEDLVRVGAYFIGRQFRRSPGGPEEELGIDTLLALAGREGLRQRMLDRFLNVLQRRLPAQPRIVPPERTLPQGSELA
jgi:hypothetical protein